eukprot:jgi/Botrbrau1/2432/Bobra.0395s0054.1
MRMPPSGLYPGHRFWGGTALNRAALHILKRDNALVVHFERPCTLQSAIVSAADWAGPNSPGSWSPCLRSHKVRRRLCSTAAARSEGETPNDTAGVQAGGEGMVDKGPRGETLPSMAAGHPLVTPHVIFAAAALGGLSLTVVAGFAPDSLPLPLKLVAFTVLQNPETAFRVAAAALAIHVVEAVGTAIVGFRRGYDVPALAWWALMAFLFGYIGIDAMNRVHAGQAPQLLKGRFHFKAFP